MIKFIIDRKVQELILNILWFINILYNKKIKNLRDFTEIKFIKLTILITTTLWT